MHYVSSSTWEEYSQIQSLFTQHWIEQSQSLNQAFAQENPAVAYKNNSLSEKHDEELEKNETIIINNNEGFALSGAAATATLVGEVMKTIFNAFVHNGPDIIKWFEEHHKKVSAPQAPNITWKKIELKIMKCAQIGIPICLGGIVLYEYLNPTSKSTQIVTLAGLALNFLASYRGNAVAKNITDIEKQYASSAGLNLGLAAAQPALISNSSVPNTFTNNFALQAEEGQKITCCEIPMPCLSCCSPEPKEKQRTWTQCFTDPCGCLPVWMRCSKKEKEGA